MNQIRLFFNYPVRLFVFWLLWFAGFRLWFVLHFYRLWPAEAPGSVWQSFWYALPLDLSFCCYLMVVPMLCWSLAWGRKLNRQTTFRKIADGFNAVVLFIAVPLFGANVFLYSEWHTLLNQRAFDYMKTPAALFDSMSPLFIVGAALLYAFAFWLSWRFYRIIVRPADFKAGKTSWFLLSLPLQAGLLAFGIRGGVRVMPINESAVYYSPHLFNNHAATNTGWHLIHTLLEQREKRVFDFMPPEEAAQRAKKWLQCPQDTLPAQWLLRPQAVRPNVVVVIMESMTAQVIESLGGVPGVCPHLDRFAREGISFSKCYSSGYRTDQGLVSVLAGFPAQPDRSIILEVDKAAQMPSMPRILAENGYHTSFFYGGELTFANIGVWLSNQQFREIWSEEDFKSAGKRQRWGADDQTVLLEVADQLNKTRQPFFTGVLTLSLHAPFDVPYTSAFDGVSVKEKFLNSAAFADAAIGKFMEAAQRTEWYKNTLFVFVADHGNSQPSGFGQDHHAVRQVPLIFSGPLIAPEFRGRVVERPCNHHDIPGTLLPALGYGNNMFWSRNLLTTQSGCTSSAYYTYEDGLGWVTDEAVGFRSFTDNIWTDQVRHLTTEDQKNAEAFLEYLFQVINQD